MIQGIFKKAIYFSLPAASKIILAFTVLPLMTWRLTAADYGFFALVVSVVAAIGVLPTVGSSAVMAKHFIGATNDARKNLIINILSLATALGAIGIILFFPVWHVILYYLPEQAGRLTNVDLMLALLAIFGSGWSPIAAEALTLEGRARVFAGVSIVRDVVGAGAGVAALYIFDMGGTSLFVSLAAASVMDVILSYAALSRYSGGRLSFSQCGILLREMHLTAANIFDTGGDVVERSLISGNIGLNVLGIVSHSKTYENMIMIVAKSLSRASWPECLTEARRPASNFGTSMMVTDIISVTCMMGAAVLATVGYDAISLLSHGKFAYAAYFAAVWMGTVALRTTGFAPKALIYVTGRAEFFSLSVIVSRVLSIGVLFFFAAQWGAGAIILAVVVSALAGKLIVYYLANRLRPVPFHDVQPLLVLAFAVALSLVSYRFATTLSERAVLGVAAVAFAAIANRGIILAVLRYLPRLRPAL